MASRLSLQAKLEELRGSKNVYFQPPQSKKLSYPCIVYERAPASLQNANDRGYIYTEHYTVTHISREPNDPVVKEIALAFPMIRPSSKFENDNLHHDVFDLYY